MIACQPSHWSAYLNACPGYLNLLYMATPFRCVGVFVERVRDIVSLGIGSLSAQEENCLPDGAAAKESDLFEISSIIVF